MTLRELYLSLPPIVRDAGLTAVAMRVDRRRYGDAFRRARAQVEAMDASAAQAETWRREREREVLQRLAETTGAPIAAVADAPYEDKAALRRRVERLREQGSLRGAIEWSTGGTTGSPIDVPVDPSEDALNTALAEHLILDRCMGFRQRPRRTAFLSGKTLCPPGQERPPFWVSDLRGGRRYYSMFHVLPQHAAAYAVDIDRFRPELWIANPSPLARLARFLKTLGWRPAARPRGIWSMAEELLEADREVIECVFECRVTNTYGMTEMAILAAECSHRTLHVSDVYGRTETIDAPGGLKELVGTSYVRTRVPVVRYRTGDLCEALEHVDCPCGLGGLAIRGLHGRSVELIHLPDGQVVSASPLADVLRRIPGVVWSSIEVTGPWSWRIHYHADRRDDARVVAGVDAEIRKRVRGPIALEAAFEASPRPPGVKPRLVTRAADAGNPGSRPGNERG